MTFPDSEGATDMVSPDDTSPDTGGRTLLDDLLEVDIDVEPEPTAEDEADRQGATETGDAVTRSMTAVAFGMFSLLQPGPLSSVVSLDDLEETIRSRTAARTRVAPPAAETPPNTLPAPERHETPGPEHGPSLSLLDEVSFLDH